MRGVDRRPEPPRRAGRPACSARSTWAASRDRFRAARVDPSRRHPTASGLVRPRAVEVADLGRTHAQASRCNRPRTGTTRLRRIAASPQRHRRDPHVLPDQQAADLLRRPDGVQPARHRPVGAQLPVHRLLRLLGRRAPARVRAEEQAVRRVRVQRADQQLPAARPRGAGVPAPARRHADGRDGLLRRGDRGDLPRARATT